VKCFNTETDFTNCTLRKTPCKQQRWHPAGVAANFRCPDPVPSGGGVAGGLGEPDTCVSFSSRSSTWRSPCRRAAGAWWGARWTAGSQRGQPGRSAPRHVVLAVSPPCPLSPHASACSADGTPSPGGSHSPQATGLSTGMAPSHTKPFVAGVWALSRSWGVGFFEQSGLFSKYLKVKNAV